MLVTKQLMLHNIYFYLFAYHGSQWGPSTVWLPTFLNISYFVLNRIKKLVLSCKLWKMLKILHKIISACKFCPVFLYAVLLNNTFDMIGVRSVLFSAMGKYLENLSIKKLLWRHAEGFSEKTHKQLFIQIKMFITTNFSTEHCEQAFKPCLFSTTLIFECNDFTSKSNQQMKDKSHCHTFFFQLPSTPECSGLRQVALAQRLYVSICLPEASLYAIPQALRGVSVRQASGRTWTTLPVLLFLNNYCCWMRYWNKFPFLSFPSLFPSFLPYFLISFLSFPFLIPFHPVFFP